MIHLKFNQREKDNEGDFGTSQRNEWMVKTTLPGAIIDRVPRWIDRIDRLLGRLIEFLVLENFFLQHRKNCRREQEGSGQELDRSGQEL